MQYGHFLIYLKKEINDPIPKYKKQPQIEHQGQDQMMLIKKRYEKIKKGNRTIPKHIKKRYLELVSLSKSFDDTKLMEQLRGSSNSHGWEKYRNGITNM